VLLMLLLLELVTLLVLVRWRSAVSTGMRAS